MKGKGDFTGHAADYRLLQCPDCGEVRLGEMERSAPARGSQGYLSFASCAEEKEDEAALKHGYADWVKPSERAKTEMSAEERVSADESHGASRWSRENKYYKEQPRRR